MTISAVKVSSFSPMVLTDFPLIRKRGGKLESIPGYAIRHLPCLFEMNLDDALSPAGGIAVKLKL